MKFFLTPGNYFVLESSRFKHHKISFSQEGEDMILSRFFEGENASGFYVDVGAHHPQRFSNTYLFYLQGWRGINIDPLPGSMGSFNESRPRDINLECAISDKAHELTYYEFNEPALNSFSKELAEQREGLRDYRLIGTRKITTHRLADILAEHLPKNQQIDFLNVDVEGLDLQVLRSNDWEKYRPTYVLAENLQREAMDRLPTAPVVVYMREIGYELYSKTVNTLIFRRSS
jgi:FkbM family methyltransferase